MEVDDDPILNSDSPLASSEESALSPDNPASRDAEPLQSVLSELKETVPGIREYILSEGLNLAKAVVEEPVPGTWEPAPPGKINIF